MNERWQEDRDDDISKLFRDNEEQLEETPSLRTWDRVERKLERRRGQKRKVMYRYTSMVAASIGILAMIYFIGFLDSFPDFEGMAQKSETKAPSNTNTEKQNTRDEELAVLEEQVEYTPIDKDNFEEVEEETFEELEIDKEPIASNFNDQRKKKEQAVAPVKNEKTQINKDAKGKVNQSADMVRADVKPSAKIETPSPDWRFSVEDDDKADVIVDNKSTVINQEEELVEPSTARKKLNTQGNPSPKKVNKESSKKNKSSRTTTSSPSTYADKEKAEEPQQTYSINQFNWMKGAWKDISIGGSYESWTIGKNGLNGSGYVVINGDTSFVEEMRIYQRGKDIFFEGPVDATQKTRKFKLESYEGNEATFNRKGKNFPNQVIITRHTNSSYSIVYQNKDAIKVDTTEQLYFKYRNRLNSQRAARNMTRY